METCRTGSAQNMGSLNQSWLNNCLAAQRAHARAARRAERFKRWQPVLEPVVVLSTLIVGLSLTFL